MQYFSENSQDIMSPIISWNFMTMNLFADEAH